MSTSSPKNYKADFPIFANNPGLVFLDSAASLQKSSLMIEGIKNFLEHDYANIHRGNYPLAERSEDLYEASKRLFAQFIGAKANEIVYTYNATYAYNMLAELCVANGVIGKGELILLGISEHHADIVPWQIAAEQVGAEIEFFGFDEKTREIDYDDLRARLRPEVKIVAHTLASNVTGKIFDISQVRSIIGPEMLLVVDASQALASISCDVQALGCDVLIGTGHKLGADTGIGMMRLSPTKTKTWSPVRWGGSMIESVNQKGRKSISGISRFEPGTPHIVGALTLLRALEYIESIGGYEEIASVMWPLKQAMVEGFAARPWLQLIGPATVEGRVGVFSFIIPGYSKTQHRGEWMGMQGICIRCGGHCTHPLWEKLGVTGACRASLRIYNDLTDVERFFAALDRYYREFVG